MLVGPLWGEVRLFRDVLRLKGTNNKILQNSKSEPKKFTFSCNFKGTVSRHGFPIFWKQFTDRVNIEGGVFLTFLEASPSAVLNNKRQENSDGKIRVHAANKILVGFALTARINKYFSKEDYLKKFEKMPRPLYMFQQNAPAQSL
jgi:hypothetical protein